jgi:hypothetical protein
MTQNPAKKAFEAFAAEYDHESNDWLDMDVGDFFEAGYAAALRALQGGERGGEAPKPEPKECGYCGRKVLVPCEFNRIFPGCLRQ